MRQEKTAKTAESAEKILFCVLCELPGFFFIVYCAAIADFRPRRTNF